MLFEFDEETRDFVTIYDRDYYPKQRSRGTKYIPPTSLGSSSNFYKDAYYTRYQLDYSRNPDEYFPLCKKQTDVGAPHLRLPNDWIIPETVHRKTYRNIREIMSSVAGIGVRKMMKHPNNLDPNMEQRKILKVRTGDTEYMAAISSTGDRILREKILQGMKSFRPSKNIKIDCSAISKKPK
ncbi:uncharacterized protein [Fopius arisanus]|uniref:Uncharacterized protein n=1 Tax=Fopius arisanus TaxID=64838 RepID=A0A9R1TPB6_9HYME|nr:PREDICTED: uncharacterized protein LOC105272709 [Fopius arisanus]